MLRNKPFGLTKKNAIDRSKHLDIVVSSAELKKLILQRCKNMDIRPSDICAVMNIPWQHFKKHYLETDNPEADMYAVTQENLIIIARELNIRVRVSIIVDEIDPEKKKFFRSGAIRWTNDYRHPET
jgi:hypothetical protein